MRPAIERGLTSKASRVALWSLFGLLVAAFVAAISSLLINGAIATSKKEIAAAAVLAAIPLMLYGAVRKPFVFPMSLYAVLVPFDNLLALDPRYGTLTKLVAICAGAAFVFLFLRTQRIISPDRVVFAWLGLLVWMALSVFWAVDPDTAVSTLVTYAELILLYVVVSIAPVTRLDFNIFGGAIVVGALASSIYAIHLFHSGIDIHNAQIGQQLTSRVIVQAGEARIDPNAFAAALLFPISLVFMLVLQKRWSLSKLALFGLLLILLGGVYVTSSRGAIVALGALMLYLIFKSRYRAQVLSFSVVGLAAVMVLTNPFARFGNALQTGGAGRLSIWKVGLEALKQYWFAGAGVGNFPYAYDQSFITTYERVYAQWHRVAHNTPLTLAVELGIVGLAVGLLGWYLQYRTLHFVRRYDSLYDLRVALEGGLVALFVASLFLSNFVDKYVWLGFSLMAAARSLALARASTPPYHGQLVTLQGSEMASMGTAQKVAEHA